LVETGTRLVAAADSIVKVQRILILGRGGSGKSTLARRLGTLTGFPVIELDQWFWQPGLVATPRDRWVEVQNELIQAETWIIDGDLGPYDVFEPRLEVADTVIILDFSLPRCAWRSIRRSSEGIAFWRWVIGYRRRSLPVLMATIATHAPRARVHLLRTPHAAEALLASISTGESRGG
jgi:adenylate kinase family enzyme